MAKNKTLHQLDFDSSGSASVRFAGPIAEVGIHYANAKLPMIKMVCPKTISSSNDCPVCASGATSNQRNLAIGWDCRMQRWCVYLGTLTTFKEIFRQCRDAGATAQMMASGLGPDVILTRIGSGTEIVVMPETIGQKRGEVKLFDPITVLNEIATESIYTKFDSVAEVEAAYSKQVQASGVMGVSGYSGVMGFSGLRGFAGNIDAELLANAMVSPLRMRLERLQLVKDAAPKPKVPAEPEAVKAVPKNIKENVEVKKLPTGEDRWDLLG